MNFDSKSESSEKGKRYIPNFVLRFVHLVHLVWKIHGNLNLSIFPEIDDKLKDLPIFGVVTSSSCGITPLLLTFK